MKITIKYFLLLLVLVSFTESEKSKIELAIKNGKQFLKKIQRYDGAICDTVNPLFDTWETIIAADALYEIDKDTTEPSFKKAIIYLRNNENANGLICHNKKCKQVYCLETTAEYFSLLLKIGETEKVKSRLKAILDLQKQTGEWEIGNPNVTEEKNFPSVTAFMLQLLNKVNLSPTYQKEAYDWLLNKQNEQGHFGNAWEYYNCPAYALWPMMQINTNNKQFIAAKERANAYILKSQYKNGCWNYIDLTINKGPSAELQTALMLSALENNYSIKNKEATKKGIGFLLNKQNINGSWDGGDFPIKSNRYIKKEYVFATALSLMTLNAFQKEK
jgi:hypothetical protein